PPPIRTSPFEMPTPDDQASDNELLRQYVRSRSESAFAALVSRHGDWVYSICLRGTAHHADLAQDAAQAVFLTLARKAESLLGHASLAGWLYRTARNTSFAIMKW